MGYVKQSEIKPIIAKQYLINHWTNYDVVDTKEDFIALLNILQACGETLDSLHYAVNEFCDILHNGCWETDREVTETLFEFCTFYTEQEFINMILERREDYVDETEYVEEMRLEATDDVDGNNDCQITKTDDGYVRRIWC